MNDKQTITFNKKYITFLSSIFIFMIVIGFSYAYWRKTIIQANSNTITTLSCLDTTISDTTPSINLIDAYAISDTEGMSGSPYTFTITNNCSVYVKVGIKLEVLNTSTLSSSYLKVSLNSSGVNYNNSRLLTNYDSTAASIENATAYMINNGVYLNPNSSKSFDLRAWIDEATSSEEGMNKTFSARITLTYDPKESYSTNGEAFAWTHSGETTDNGGMELIKEPLTTQLKKTTEYRYYGSNPNNYISFNSELWRIIGVFETENANSTLEYRLKLVRNESLGTYSYDSSSSDINTGYGINEWSQSDLVSLLNNTYYGMTSGTCYNGSNNTSTYCDFSSSGLSLTAKSLIDKAKYYTAGYSSNTITSLEFYTNERASALVVSPSDGFTRLTNYINYVGLINPSDYGYAASADHCLRTNTLNNYNSSCYSYNYLYKNSNYWTINPGINNAYNVYYVKTDGSLDTSETSTPQNIYPVVYLKPDANITSGIGTIANPYIIN